MTCALKNLKVMQNCFRSLTPNVTHNTRLSSPFMKCSVFDVDHLNGSFRQLHVSLPRNTVKPRDRKDLLRHVPKTDEGLGGEGIVSLDAVIKSKEDMFTDERTPDLLFNGVRFAELPVCSVRVTKNNTILCISSHKGKGILLNSCGIEGFKNSRKGTNVAAQAAALTLSQKAVGIGIVDVRLKIKGLGPGRMAAIKGLQLGGLNIISITDDTTVPWRLRNRPKKQRRL